MKHTIKKILAAMLCLCFVFAFASCTGSNSGESTATTSADGKTLKIGIIQYVSHPSLDNCYTGIKNALDESGLNMQIDRQIGSDNAADSDCASYAKNMVPQQQRMPQQRVPIFPLSSARYQTPLPQSLLIQTTLPADFARAHPTFSTSTLRLI